jgi:hypothetical protein
MLKIRQEDGYFLSSETYSLWHIGNKKNAIYVQKTYMDAAVRLAQFRDDFDIKHLDAFCICIQGAAQQGALRSWILQVCNELLDPRKSKQNKFSLNPKLSRVTSGLNRGSAYSFSFKTKDQEAIRSDFSAENASQEERYMFFKGKVAKLQIWQECDYSLFKELKYVAQGHMDKIARQCELRFEELWGEADAVPDPHAENCARWSVSGSLCLMPLQAANG